MLRVMIIDNAVNTSKPLKQSLIENGFDVIAPIENNGHIHTQYYELQPDIVIINLESPTKAVLDSVGMIANNNISPVVMFSQDGNREVVKAATKAGVSAYVVGAISSERLTPVIDAAIARFEETKQLRDALKQANEKLDERKVIERAKGILMRQRRLDEDDAYKMLRSMAMKKNMKLADLSNQLIEAAKMLTI